MVLGLLFLVLIAFNHLFGEDSEEDAPTTAAPVTTTEPEVVEEAPPLDSRVPAVITAAVVHTLGHTPEGIHIRRAGISTGKSRRTAAIVAAALSQVDKTPDSIDIRKV